jgi:predicted component of type VI protein secretion system
VTDIRTPDAEPDAQAIQLRDAQKTELLETLFVTARLQAHESTATAALSAADREQEIRGLNMVKVFGGTMAEATQGKVLKDPNLYTIIQEKIDELDSQIAAGLNKVLHNKEFQKLEATWRGLHYLVSNTETSTRLKLRVLDVTEKEMRDDLEKALDFDQSALFKKIYEEEYGTLGGKPYGCLVADISVDRSPDSLSLLTKLASVAAASHAPLIAAADAKLFDLEGYDELPRPRDLAKIFESSDMAEWNAFRESEDSRYVTLTLPRVLMRLPYHPVDNPVDGLSFKEDVGDEFVPGQPVVEPEVARLEEEARKAKEAEELRVAGLTTEAKVAAELARVAALTAEAKAAEEAAERARVAELTAEEKAKEEAEAARVAGLSPEARVTEVTQKHEAARKAAEAKKAEDAKKFKEAEAQRLLRLKPKAENYLWGNPAFVLAQRITEAFAMYSWTAAIRGVEGGGKVEGLPLHKFKSLNGDKAMIVPTEVSITDRREKELSDLGFVSLVYCKDTNYAAFFGSQTVNKPKKYNLQAANSNAELSARLPYILNTSRFAHYIKVMMRNRVGSFMTKENVQTYLTTWISDYVLDKDDAGQELKAKYPLREARIDVSDVPGQPGAYSATVFLRPHFQLEGLSASLRLVAELPAAAA